MLRLLRHLCMWLLVAAGAALAAVPAARAQDASDAARRESARRLGSEGLQAFDEGSYVAAVERLTRAIAARDAPTLRLYRARAFGRMGRWVEACQDYDAILRSPPGKDESVVAAEAREAATDESSEAYARTAKLSLERVGFTERAVRLDGALWPAEQLGTVRELDPGTHLLEVERPPGEPLRIELKLAEGEMLRFSLDSLEAKRRSSVPASPRRLSLPGVQHSARLSEAHPTGAGPLAAASERADTFYLDFALYSLAIRSIELEGVTKTPFAGSTSAFYPVISLRWFPFSGVLHDWLGVTARGGARGAGSIESQAGLRGRRVWDPLTFGFEVVFGQLRTAPLDEGTTIPHYAMLEPGLDLTWQIGDCSLSGAVGAILPYYFGMEAQYPDVSGYGFEATVALEYRLWRWLGVQLSVRGRRIDLDLGTPVRDPTFLGDPAEGSAVDDYLMTQLSLTLNL